MKTNNNIEQSRQTLMSYLKHLTEHFKLPMCPLERFILEFGQDFKSAKRPRGVRKMANKQCYRNATKLSMRLKLDYAEGFGICDSLPIPLFHAWCVAKDGTVVDPTWLKPENSLYRGVIIPKKLLREEILKHGVYGVLDYGMINLPVIEQLRISRMSNLVKAQGATQ